MPTPSAVRRITTLAVSAGALCALAACSSEPLSPRQAMPGRAQLDASAAPPSLFHPNAEKYADRGAKPSTGRSGSAVVTSRALLARDGTTLIEATTGELDASATPPGQIAKAQLKTLTTSGDAIQTVNFNGLTGGGYWSTTTEGLLRNAPIQVQTNVRGIDQNRTDVVTVEDTVKRRPDVAVSSIGAPAQAYLSQSFSVTAVVKELNGDVGARANCVLLVDGTQVDQANGIWVDAAGTVSCAFVTSIAATGTHTLEVQATDVTPGDWDSANNAASTTIEIVLPIVKMSWHANAIHWHTTNSNIATSHTEPCSDIWYCYTDQSTYDDVMTYDASYVYMDASAFGEQAEFPASIAFDAISGGATVAQLHVESVSPPDGQQCSNVYDAATSSWGSLCASTWGTSAWFERYPGTSTYYSAGSSIGSATYLYCTGWGWSSCQWYTYPHDYSWSSNYSYGTPAFALGSDVKLHLTITDATGRQFVAGGTISLTPFSHSNSSPYCYTATTWYTYTMCGTYTYESTGVSGWASGYGTD